MKHALEGRMTPVIVSGASMPLRDTSHRLLRTPESRESAGLFTGTMLLFVVQNMGVPLIPLMGIELGASPGQIGAVLGLASFVVAPITIPTGLALRRIGSRRMILISGGVAVFGYVAVYCFPLMAVFVVGVLLGEVTRMMATVAVQTHTAGLSRGRDSSVNFGRFGVSAAVGQMIGPAIGGFIIDNFGLAATWGVMALILGATTIAFRFLIGPGHAAPREDGKAPFSFREFMSVSTTAAIACAFLVAMTGSARDVLLPIFLANAGFTATLIGAVFSLRALISMLARLAMGPILKAFGGRFQTMIAFMVFYAIGIGTTSLCRTPVLLVSNVVLIGVGMAVIMPLSMAAVADSVRKEDRAVAMSIRLTGNRTAQMIGPLAFGGLAEAMGIGGSLWVAGGVMLGGILMVALWWRGR